jgi:hypothetical protein
MSHVDTIQEEEDGKRYRRKWSFVNKNVRGYERDLEQPLPSQLRRK